MKYYARKVQKLVRTDSFNKMGLIPFIEFIATEDIEKYNKMVIDPFKESRKAKKILTQKEYRADYIYTLSEFEFNKIGGK